jgi:hypothetical protein
MEATPGSRSEFSLPQRIWGTFAAPRIVFQYLGERPRLLGALLVLIAVHVAISLLLGDIAFEAQIRQLEARPDMSAEQLAQAEKMIAFTRKAAPVLAAATPVVTVYVLAGILLLITNVLLKGRTTYRHLAAAVAHVALIVIPASIVQVPLVLAKGDINVQTSPAAFLSSAGDKGILYHFLAQFDVFFLWKLGLTVLAVSILGRIPVKRAAYGVAGAWVVWMLIWVPLASKFPG